MESVASTGASGGPPPSSARTWRHVLPWLAAGLPAGLTLAIVVTLLGASHLQDFGPRFLGWNAANRGIAVFVLGTFLTSVPALLGAMLVGLGIAIASTTYLPRLLAAWLDPIVDLLSGIPSIVYGLWGFLVVAPFFGRQIFPWTAVHLAWLPGFAGNRISPSSTGDGLALAIVVLTLMILPITTLLMREALRTVPVDLWESGLALGATRWEVTRRIAVPYAKRGIWGAAFLGFGRAVGETVAVFMVIDQLARVPVNVYGGTATMATLLIGAIDEAFQSGTTGMLELHFLAELALVLLGVTFAVNFLGRWFVRRTFSEVAGI